MFAPMWTATEAHEIESIAKKELPNVKFYANSHGLQVERGPDAIVEHLNTVLPRILNDCD